MDDDWENEAISEIFTKVQTKSPWDDEDVDEDNVKESWEEEDDKTKPNQPAAVKDLKKRVAKASEKKGKTVEVTRKEEALDSMAEKLRQQRIVEEADFISTGNKTEQKTLNNFIPKSETDFKEYAQLIAQKLCPHQKSYHYTELLKAVMRLSTTALTGKEAKEIASSVTAIANQKIKAEKEAINGGRKKAAGGKKKQLFLDRPDDAAVINAYHGYDDYD